MDANLESLSETRISIHGQSAACRETRSWGRLSNTCGENTKGQIWSHIVQILLPVVYHHCAQRWDNINESKVFKKKSSFFQLSAGASLTMDLLSPIQLSTYFCSKALSSLHQQAASFKELLGTADERFPSIEFFRRDKADLITSSMMIIQSPLSTAPAR